MLCDTFHHRSVSVCNTEEEGLALLTALVEVQTL